MLIWKTLSIADHERALLYRRGRLVDLLGPGHYRLNRLQGEITAEVFDITAGPFRHGRQQFLLHQFGFLLSEHLQTFEVCEHQVGLLYRDARLIEILPPATSLTLWRDSGRLHLETIAVEQDGRIAGPVLEGLIAARSRPELADTIDRALTLVLVKDDQLGVLSVDGRQTEVLKPGSYGFWRFNRSVAIEILPLGPVKHTVGNIDCLTQDGRAISVDLIAWSKVVNAQALLARRAQVEALVSTGLRQALHGILQSYTLAKLLGNAGSLPAELMALNQAHFAVFGIELQDVGVGGVRLQEASAPTSALPALRSA